MRQPRRFHPARLFLFDNHKATCSTAAMIHAPAYQFEHDFAREAKDRGMIAYVVHKQLKYDVIVKGFKVQCKRLDWIGPNNSLKISKTQKYRVGDFDVLALLHDSTTFLIPSWRLESNVKQGWLTTRINPFDYKHWIDAWSVFDGEKECDQPQRQSLLFEL